ncbi:MAG: gliding motility-associated C-terminal domain-containing protein [Bacteroidia bacterium]|nr:gliding motility-associated C-terminal domain-containing protein [Bacteroidia bacterium]
MMHKSIFRYFIVLGILVLATNVFGQVSNDECNTALLIENVNACSEAGAFNNATASPSGFSQASCHSSVNGDMWFQFVAEFTSVTIVVRGEASSNPGGTLLSPAVSLYTGNCNGTIDELACGTDLANSHVAEVTKDGLIVGETYYIRVDTRVPNMQCNRPTCLGSFQLCISNFNLPANPGSDCVTSSVLCDKSSFTVQSVIGAGSDVSEMDGSPCFVGTPTNIETNSTWFTWTADSDGTLEFTLTPLNITDDLDFVVYELPNGVSDCSGKNLIRCMASGQGTFSDCLGPTGLRAGSTDTSENSGCEQASDDNFLRPLDMVEGGSYALVVNNFSGSGNGFEIDFDGSGEFKGPKAAFTYMPDGTDACLGGQIDFDDASTIEDGFINKWSWTFGTAADILQSNGADPPPITYSEPGPKQVTLTVESDQGCLVTTIEEVLIDPCCQTLNAISETASVVDLQCADIADGQIALSVSSNLGPHQILWEDGSSIPDRNDLASGLYSVAVSSVFCDTTFQYTVGGNTPITNDTLITMPTCNGGMDGAVTLNTMGGVGPYQYNWNNTGYTDNSTLSNIGVNVYPVIIRDALGCDDTLQIDVRELELLLVPGEQNIFQPSCFGFDDGRVVLNIDNGAGPYSYDFNDSFGFVTQNERTGLIAGEYNVDVLDANLCKGSFSFDVQDHPPVELVIDKKDISCFGEVDGEAVARISGGVGGYIFSWNNGSQDSIINSLLAGEYILMANDANNCRVEDTIVIIEPDQINLTIDNVVDVICFGDATGSITVVPIGGSGDFIYSIDGSTFTSNTTFENLIAKDYTLTIKDINECTTAIMGSVTQPEELIVDAGSDQTIKLGFDTIIISTYSPGTQSVIYNWTPPQGLSCTDCFDPIANPVVSTTFVVQITDETNCVATDSINIFVEDFRPIFIPNVFSPNADGRNDFLGIYSNIAGVGIDIFQIYDRWGSLVYEAENLPLNDPNSGWDGKFGDLELNTGVYVYFAKVRFLDDKVLEYKGDVLLVR